MAKIQDGNSTLDPGTIDRLSILDPLQATGSVGTFFFAKDKAALSEIMDGLEIDEFTPDKRSIDDGYNRSCARNRSEVIVGIGLKNMRDTYKSLYSQEVVSRVFGAQIRQRFPYTCIISPPDSFGLPLPPGFMNDTDVRAALYHEGCFNFDEKIARSDIERDLRHTKSLNQVRSPQRQRTRRTSQAPRLPSLPPSHHHRTRHRQFQTRPRTQGPQPPPLTHLPVVRGHQ